MWDSKGLSDTRSCPFLARRVERFTICSSQCVGVSGTAPHAREQHADDGLLVADHGEQVVRAGGELVARARHLLQGKRGFARDDGQEGALLPRGLVELTSVRNRSEHASATLALRLRIRDHGRGF